MANIDASTPQLKAVKKWIETICSFDVSGAVSLTSGNFKYQSLPKTVDLPDKEKDGHIQWLGLMTTLTKFEVRLQQHLQASRLISTHLGHNS
jgi:hypothetical protein